MCPCDWSSDVCSSDLNLNVMNPVYTLSGTDLVNDGKPSPHPVFYTSHPSIKIDMYAEPKSDDVKLTANYVVAESMILANATVALYSAEHNLPMPFRCLEYHPGRPETV